MVVKNFTSISILGSNNTTLVVLLITIMFCYNTFRPSYKAIIMHSYKSIKKGREFYRTKTPLCKQ
jgi:hypothetical protein